MTTPKRHRYVPRMMLRRFTYADERLFFFDERIKPREVRTSTVDGLFFHKHLYSLTKKDGTRDVSLEHFYSKLESAANPVIEKICAAARAGNLPNLTPDEKYSWDIFSYHLWKRAPDFYDKLGVVQDFEQKFEAALTSLSAKAGLTTEQQDEVRQPEAMARIRKNAIITALGKTDTEAIDVLSSRGLAVAAIRKANKSFLIGSNPVVRLSSARGTDLRDRDVELWIPIASYVAVSPGPRDGEEMLVAMHPDHVRHINRAIFEQSTVIAGRSDRLIASIAGCR